MRSPLYEFKPVLLALPLVLLGMLFNTAGAQQPKPPDVVLPPNEVPKALVSFTSAQTDDVVDWSIKDLKIPEVWARGVTGKGFVVDVIDTMGSSDHPDLKGQLLAGKSYTGEPLKDGNGHGTWCAGHIVAAKDGKGMVGGAYGAKARGRKVLSNGGSGSVTGIASSIDDAVKDDADVISGSLGGPAPDQWTKAATKRAVDAGVLCVYAAGNDGPGANSVDWPGAFAVDFPEGVICVAAHDKGGTTASFSSRGKMVTITLGGVDTQGCWVNGQYVIIDGTSMATPSCASLYLLWMEAKGQKLPRKDRPKSFISDLIKACDAPNSRTPERGYGKPDAVKLCFGLTDVPPPGDPPPLGDVLTIDFGRTVTLVEKSGTKVTVVLAPPGATPTGPTPTTEPAVNQLVPLVPATQCPGGVCPPPTNGAPKWMPSAPLFSEFRPFGGRFRR